MKIACRDSTSILGWKKVVSNTRTWPADRTRRTERLRNRLRVKHDGEDERMLESHWEFRTYNAAELRGLIEKVPEFEAVAFHDFNCQIGIERQLDNEYEDIVLVLKRR